MNPADNSESVPPAPEENPSGSPRPEPTAPPEPIAPPQSVRGDENPYAAPLEGTWVEHATGGANVGNEFRAAAAPWGGGWGLMVLVVGLLSGLGLAIAIQVDHVGIGGLLVPICGLGLIAVLVRFLHGSVDVEWPIYLLVSAAFGVVAYFAFIPVCIVVGIPVMILMDQANSFGPVAASVAIFMTVMGCGLIFTILLRLYFNNRYRKQCFKELAGSVPPAPEAAATGDPYAAPRD